MSYYPCQEKEHARALQTEMCKNSRYNCFYETIWREKKESVSQRSRSWSKNPTLR